MKSSEQKEIEWKEKRRGKITASTLPDLMKAGKGCPFGKAALDAMYLVRYERRTGTMRENGSNKAFDWGHENEPLAVEWVRSQLMNEIKSCTTDFKDIVFNEPFEGFGDSPDFYVYGFDGKVIALGEIKCPMSQGKSNHCNSEIPSTKRRILLAIPRTLFRSPGRRQIVLCHL